MGLDADQSLREVLSPFSGKWRRAGDHAAVDDFDNAIAALRKRHVMRYDEKARASGLVDIAHDLKDRVGGFAIEISGRFVG